MGVLRDFRRAVDALERIASGLNGAVRALHENSPATERLEELERSRALWEADVEGMLQKAEGKLKAAANSEARERTMRKAYENELDPFGEDREELQEAFQEGDAEIGYPEEVLPVRMGVEAISKKQQALRMKFSCDHPRTIHVISFTNDFSEGPAD